MEMPTRKTNPEAESPEEELAQSEPVPANRGVAATFRDAFRRAKERRQGSSSAETAKARSELSRDKTKTLFAMVAAIVALLIVFLGLFSSSHEQVQREQAARRGKPSLGRPETGTETRRPGSVTPMLSAEMAGQDPPTDEVTPEDVNNTSRQKTGDSPVASAKPTPGQRSAGRSRTRASDPQALGNIPFSDPALEAYRQQVIARSASNSRQAAAQGETGMSAPPTPTQQVANQENPLAKSSLLFVTAPRARLQQSGSGPSQAATLTAPASELQLPSGTRLMARLQTAVSSAVKAPVVAVVETHYERDGEIVIPAGSRVIGELQGANRNGIVNIRFNELRMPDGESLKLEAGAMSLTFGPLQGQVTGTNRGKRFLARALTGVGTVAAFSVGRSGGVGLAGPLDNSIFLRERLAQNIGIAGEQELMNLAFTQDIVVTVPGNTRFFVVLHQSTKGIERSGAAPPADAPRGTLADLPSTAELRELMSLGQEIRRLRSATDRASASSSDGR